MGQKTSPISTRLYGNCWPDSCWYSDANRFSLFYQDFNQKQDLLLLMRDMLSITAGMLKERERK